LMGVCSTRITGSRMVGDQFLGLIDYNFEEAEATGHGRIVQRQLT
jgi:hypothetical protein